MIRSPTLQGLAFVLSGTALLLSGCGDSGGGGGSGSGGAAGPAYDGTGSEALGYYVAEVATSTGFYADAGHYAPVGLTRHLGLYLSGGSLYLDYTYNLAAADSDGDVALIADPDAKTYYGTVRWTPNSGPLALQPIDEAWTVAFTGQSVTLSISGQGPTADDVGTVSFILRPLAMAPVSDSSYGRVTRHSDVRSVGQVTWQDITLSTYGAQGYIRTDAAYMGYDSFWAPLYRSGNSLRGGQLAYTQYQNDHNDVFAKLDFTLDALGRPSAASVTVADYSNLDDDLEVDIEPASWSVSAGNFRTVESYAQTYANLDLLDLAVVSVTPGGELWTAFGGDGTVLADALSFTDPSAVAFEDGPLFHGGHVSSARREIVVWDGRFYDFYDDVPDADPADLLSGYDFDGDPATEERLTIAIDYDAASLPAWPTGGSLTLEFFDPAGARTGTETLTFTLSNPGPAIIP